jgi:CRISPR-associated endoribonuclease Cas6
MRLNLRLTGNTEPVPFNHLHHLTGALHKWLGDNQVHDGLSLYSFGWLGGAESENGHLTFPQGAGWRVSFHDTQMAKRCIDGIMQDPGVAFGMRVFEVKEQATPTFSGCYRFKTDRAPVIARQRRDDGSRAYLLWGDEAADVVLTRTLRHKLKAAGFEGEHLGTEVQFDRTYQGARTKLAIIKGVGHKGSLCPVVVTGTPEAVQFAWTVGIGELTGSGFGALK